MTSEWKPDMSKARIVCSANRYTDPKGQTLYCIGARHWDQLMYNQFVIGQKSGYDIDRSSEVQGFVDQWGQFHDRKAALLIARRAGQLDGRTKSGNPDSDELFSEDLY